MIAYTEVQMRYFFSFSTVLFEFKKSNLYFCQKVSSMFIKKITNIFDVANLRLL